MILKFSPTVMVLGTWLNKPGKIKNIGLSFLSSYMGLFILCLHETSWGTPVVKSLSCVQLFATPWTVACQALLSMRFPRQEYWSGLPLPPAGYLPNPGIKPRSPVFDRQVDSLPLSHLGSPVLKNIYLFYFWLSRSSLLLGLFSSCSGWASHCGGFFCGARL